MCSKHLILKLYWTLTLGWFSCSLLQSIKTQTKILMCQNSKGEERETTADTLQLWSRQWHNRLKSETFAFTWQYFVLLAGFWGSRQGMCRALPAKMSLSGLKRWTEAFTACQREHRKLSRFCAASDDQERKLWKRVRHFVRMLKFSARDSRCWRNDLLHMQKTANWLLPCQFCTDLLCCHSCLTCQIHDCMQHYRGMFF